MSPKPQPSASPLAAVPSPSRMSLANVSKGKRTAPDRIVLHGTEGVGKSSWGAEAPNPIFIAAEDGIRFLDVASFPEPQSFEDVISAVESLVSGEHEFKTLVIDTIDWVGHLIRDKVMKANAWDAAAFDAYGRGYKVWVQEWRKLLSSLDRLRAKKGMEIILLVHSKVGNFKNPAGNDYGRYQLAIGGDEAPELVKQWADIVLFATHEEFTTDPKKGRVKGVSSGQRIVNTERTAAWDAKHRHGLPPQLPLDYAAFDEARKAGGVPADPSELLAECERLANALELPADHKARAFIATNQNKPEMLTRSLNTLRAMASEAGIQ